MRGDKKTDLEDIYRAIKAIGSGGLTRRELYAALAMQSMDLKDRGCWSENDIKRGDHIAHPNRVAKAAVDYADALILALKGKR